ncbi:UvrD-helicase domain-containing protein [Salinibacterium sp. ZJ454]|uniref:HelD family protein n=1 Tax=Salinibacterium sp. ZJ454 TaxID=2708339 RepID=UPI00141E7F92|nr:UvrD-helicase domain-containing protein [Salinibacterium sp. ZJ454]
MTNSELERERDYVERLYRRLDDVRQEAEDALAAVRRQTPGGTHQHRSERDSFARIYEDRIAQLREVDERLAFGKLTPQSGSVRYIGRIGLRDDNRDPILLDWRAPQASAFYQATAATPLGMRARRHLSSKGRKVVSISDDIFDESLLSEQVSGDSALLAALTAQRTGRMHDIVATIQAEQDRIIRSELRGVLVVQGGPGTGKTAVALHRAAYLLYENREQLARSGVLIVGPSRSFLQYIEQVLPSLGETGVVLASVGQLYPGVDAQNEDTTDVAALKGSRQMADLIKRAVKSRQIVPTEPQTLDVSGERLVVQPQLIADAMREAWQSRKPHNVARVTFNKAALKALARQLASQLREQGNAIDDSDLSMLREDLRSSYDVRVALNTAWLPLTPEKLIQDLYARPTWLASLTPGWSPAKRALLRRSRDAEFTVSDIPLLDEAAELLGEMDTVSDARKREEKAQRKRDVENAEQAIQNMDVEGMVSAEALAAGFAPSAERLSAAERASSDRTWTYGHIVVDEAQELSPMQWRVLLRRGPMRSFTIVGDIAQASSAAAAASWSDALGTLTTEFRLEELTVNYRTPSQITDAAERFARAHGLPITPSTAVRRSEWEIFRRGIDDAGLLDAALAAVQEDRGIDDRGTVAVIADDALVPELYQHLRTALGADVALGSASLARPISVLSPQTSKGLEFDAVVLVDPDSIERAGSRGASALYVAATRPTQRLHIVTTGAQTLG